MGDSPLPGGGGPPGPDFGCLSSACTAAKSAVVDAANAIISKCGQVASANATAAAMLAIATAILGLVSALTGYLIGAIGVAAAIALLAAATVSLNWLLAWVIISLIATALIFLTIWAAMMIYVAVLQSQLGSLQNDFLSDVAIVKKVCPSNCWSDVDLRLPSC